MVIGSGRAPGKVILFGEHAVVYGRPALAVPVTEVQATATVEPGATGAGLVLRAVDLGDEVRLRDAPAEDPLAAITRLTLAFLELVEPDWVVVVRSTVPIASGLGSGAAVSVAIARALAAAAERRLAPSTASELAFEVEKLHHGTPSGVDNTVIAFEQPVYFRHGQEPAPFPIGQPFMLAIGDSGIRSPTRVTVGDVRKAWLAEPPRLEGLFDQIAGIVEAARLAIANGQPHRLGPLMDRNHRLLAEIGVSCPELEALAEAARGAGALGAKVSGGGRGGNLIALVEAHSATYVTAALRAAGATRVMATTVG